MSRSSSNSPIRLSALGAALAVVAALATLAAVVEPHARLAHRSLPLQAAFETAAALIASLVAYLMAGRFVRTRGRRDLLVAVALAGFALSNLCFAAIPDVTGDRDTAFASWGSAVGILASSALLAFGSLVSNRAVGDPRRAGWTAALAVAGLTGLIATFAGALGDGLPVGADPDLSPADAAAFSGDAWLIASRLLTAGFMAVAAIGFARQAREGDELMEWFSAGAVLALFARLNYALYPSSLLSWIGTGDALRFGFYVVLLVGAAREIGRYQRELAAAAMAEERRRVARDLHDGLAQEVAFLTTASERVAAGRASPDEVRLMTEAAARAMTESRMLIETLAAEPVPLAEAIERAAKEVGDRAGVVVELTVPGDAAVAVTAQDALARIVREAVANAARHGGATRVAVELSVGEGVRLRIADDGRGFDPAAVTGAGFGLTSMRERARALGGELRIESGPAGGTEVVVVIP